MRLLNVHSLHFAEFPSSQIPRYVIASHRWCTGGESSLMDVERRRNTHTPGYQKVIGFAEYVRTRVSAVDWLWIDTCCIDSRSSQEVSEAVNSMFRWYSDAEICIAWLADIDAVDGGAFTQSDWFTRGWTLQELLAPSTVVFLNREWRVIGHKGRGESDETASHLHIGRSLVPTIATLTNISEDVLRDYRASRDLGVDEKLRWTAGRKTTREEDMSYCLFGIFDVAIGANYGEGGERARRRLLKEVSMSRSSSEGDLQLQSVPHPPPESSIRAAKSALDEHLDQEECKVFKENLSFPQMGDRRAHIQVAYEGTYRWALLSTGQVDDRWDILPAWLGDLRPSSRIYWINAKPGAGKSSLVRFLEEELRVEEHMQPWAERARLVQICHYFWSPGSLLQKSLAGLLRTVLYQLFEAIPELLTHCAPLQKPNAARRANATRIDWPDFELRELLNRCISSLPSTTRVFFLIDGLDEMEGGDDVQDGLVELLKNLASRPNVKLCVSSRRWTVFQDAFAACPQLRLEDLNAHDIETFVRGQFQCQSRYRQMLLYDPTAKNLVLDVIEKAGGVFLWTRLVVKELLRGIRDGDSHHTLQQKLRAIPGDLGRYFDQILDSIEPSHRREACTLLQIALHQETEFTALHPLLLLDLVFLNEAGRDFSLENQGAHLSLLGRTEALVYQLESTLRRLSSRCKGLLECHANMELADLHGGCHKAHLAEMPTAAITALPPNMVRLLDERKAGAFELVVDFMHRSLRDHLLEPRIQRFLHQYTNGPLDARDYLRNARLVEIFMIAYAGLHPQLAVGLVSYFVSTLSIPQFRDDARCARFAARLRPVFPYVLDGWTVEGPGWYINGSLHLWAEEQSNFLTLAIDFCLTKYLAEVLAAGDVSGKRGRPLLDHVLRPRFISMLHLEDYPCSIGYQYPNPDLVRYLLALGADPNQRYEGTSIWVLFLLFLVDKAHLLDESEVLSAACASIIEILMGGGADVVLHRPDLSSMIVFDTYIGDPVFEMEPFEKRWPLLASALQPADGNDHDLHALDVLECMRPIFKDRTDALKALAVRRAEEEGASRNSTFHR